MRHKQIFVFAIVLLFSSIAFADYLDAYAKAVVQTNSTIYVRGYVKNSTGSGIANVNVTAALSSSSNNSVSASNGYFDINLTAPLLAGEYNISVSTNTSLSKIIHTYASNTTSGSINFTGSKPPFSAGVSFLINVTLWNGTAGLIINYTPSITIYKANGPAVNWTVFNTTPANSHAGYIGYNISVPANADGSYSISLDKGVITTVVLIQSTTIMAVNTQTDSNETKTNFYPGANFTIVAKIRDTNGNPIGYAVNVTARVTKPDKTVDTATLNNDTTQEGRYASSAYVTSSSSAGQYIIDVSAIVAGKTIKGSITASTQAMKARLEKQAEFFKEWGDSAAFTAGGTVGLNVIVMNLSDDSIIGGTLTGINSVNCSSGGTNVTGLYASNGSSLSIGTVTYDAGGLYMGTAVCRITFTAPSATGNYKIAFSTSVGNMIVSGSGYLEVQKYILKPNPVSSLGGAFDFAVMLYPGDNATFEVSAFDMNSQAEVAGINITNLTVTKIMALEFIGGGSDILEGGLGRSDAFNITNYTAGSNIANPTITIQLPVNRTGPFQAEVRAIINNGTTNETVTGRGFYISKYIMGFLSSFGGMMGGPPGGGEGGGGGPPGGGHEEGPAGGFGGGSACAGTENFRGNVMEIKTNSAPKDPVTFNNILQAREEMTGKSVLQCLSMTLNSSDSNGMVQVPILFNTSVSGCSSLTGFHFMLVNITYQGKQDAVPAGFSCKRLSFQPSITDNTGNMAWRIAPSGTVNMTINSIRRINDSTTIRGGTVQITRVFNFNPGSGMKMFAPNGTITATLNNGSANIVLVPTNFSILTWPTGFVSITVQVTANATYNNATDTSESGFQVTPFDSYVTQLNGAYNMWGQTLNAGQNISIMIEASTNVSRSDYTLARANTTTGFIAKVGIPWEGKMKDVSVYNATLQVDGWNNTGHSSWPNYGRERWLINLTLPANLKKGFNTIEITINNSNNEKATADIGFIAASYTIKVGQEEGLQTEDGYYSLRWGSSTASPGAILDGAGPNVQQILNKGGVGTWNLTALNSTYNLYSKSNSVCLRRGLNMTRWNDNVQVPNHFYDRNGINTAEVLLLDNSSSGIYDTVIINNTALAGSPLAVLRTGQNYTSQLYLWKIDSCGYSKWINASAISSQGWSWGGSWEKNSNFTMPYIVQKGGVAVNGATVSVNAIIKQMDSTGSGSGGFGFDRKLTSGEYTTGSVNTDANGIAFVPVSISQSGSMMIFWKLIDGSVQDIASFQSKGMSSGGDSGTQVQIRSFDAWGNKASRVRGTHATAVVMLYNFTNPNSLVWNYNYSYGAPGAQVYNGTYNETVSGSLINDNQNKSYYFLFNSTAIVDLYAIGSSMDFSGVQTGNKTNSFSIESTSIAIGEARHTGSGTTQTTLALYVDGNPTWYPVTSATQNISVIVCAQSFARPAVPYPGARVYIYAESWSMNSPMATATPLDWFDPINNTRYSFGSNGGSYSLANATTGPKGCAAFDVVHPTGWPANNPVNVKAIVTYGGSTESTWVDNVWRASQCSNMVDDDGDNKTDYKNWWGAVDPECTSPTDDDESA